MKFFLNSPNIVLRFQDGTLTSEYFYIYDLSKDVFGHYEDGTSFKNSDSVDIIIVEADKSFQQKMKSLRVSFSSIAVVSVYVRE